MNYYNNNRFANIRFFATPVNTAIVITNVVVFLVMEIMGSTTDTAFMVEHGAQYWPLIKYGGEWWRLLTCAFLHFGFRHLINNMIVLLFIGDNLERQLGKVKYAIFYLAAALGSSYISYYVNMSQGYNTVSAGASGAIFGVVGGMLAVLLLNKGRVEDLSIRNIGMFIIFSLYLGYTSAGIDNVAHLSGLAIGFVLVMIFLLIKRKRQNKNKQNDQYIYFR